MLKLSFYISDIVGKSAESDLSIEAATGKTFMTKGTVSSFKVNAIAPNRQIASTDMNVQ